MTNLLRPFIAIFTSLTLLILANGLCNTFIPIRLHLEGHTADTIGFVTSSLYAGIFLGSLWLDRWISKVGHVPSLIVCTFLLTAFTLMQTLWIDPRYWAVLRLLGGVATAGLFIGIESWLLMQTAPKQRGSILSIYLVVFYGSLSLGQLLIHFTDPMSLDPFYLIGGLSIAAIVPLLLNKIPQPPFEKTERLGAKKLFQTSPLGFSGVIISGMIVAAVFGLIPVYAAQIGLSIPEVSNLVALLIAGGLTFQWPLGKLADLYGRRLILNCLSFATITICGVIAMTPTPPPFLLFTFIFLFGGCSFTIYPISMAYVCENVENHQIVSATGGFVLAYGVGAILGPIIAPMAMQYVGCHGLFYFLGLTMTVLLCIGAVYSNKKIIIPEKSDLSQGIDVKSEEPLPKQEK